MGHHHLRGQGKLKKASGSILKNQTKKNSRKLHISKKKFLKLAVSEKGATPANAPRLTSVAAAKKLSENTSGLSRQERKRLAFAAQLAAMAPASAAVASTVTAPIVLSRDPPCDASTPSEVATGRKRTRAERRAETMREEQHLSLYSAAARTLLVGEGNFSFARALCKNMGTGENVVATCFDDEGTLNRKYSDAAAIRKDIESSYGGTTLVGVDATLLHKIKEFRGNFKTIVFNFPHLGSGETDVEKNVAQHRKLLAAFFISAAQCLSEERGAAIHVALKEGEPYKSWKIAQTFRASCPDLDLLTAYPFATTAWEGYAHRRTIGFDSRVSKADSEELSKGAKVYVFGRRKVKGDS